jgi:hypothetical protein
MGRKKLYKTEEARRAAHAASQRQYAAYKAVEVEELRKKAKQTVQQNNHIYRLLRDHRSLLYRLIEMATIEEVGVLYKRIAARLHPDNGGDGNAMAELNLLWSDIGASFAEKARVVGQQ